MSNHSKPTKRSASAILCFVAILGLGGSGYFLYGLHATPSNTRHGLLEVTSFEGSDEERRFATGVCAPFRPKTPAPKHLSYMEEDCDLCVFHFEGEEDADLMATLSREKREYSSCLKDIRMWLSKVRPATSKSDVTCAEIGKMVEIVAKDIEERQSVFRDPSDLRGAQLRTETTAERLKLLQAKHQKCQ